MQGGALIDLSDGLVLERIILVLGKNGWWSEDGTQSCECLGKLDHGTRAYRYS